MVAPHADFDEEVRMRHLKYVGSLALTALVVALTVSTARAAPVAALTLVSGPSPYAACTIGGPGTNFVNAEVEPWVDVNPTNSNNLIGVWQQDRWSNGGAHGLVAGSSFDG